MSSLTFNGTSDYARSTALVTTYPLTFASWFYVTDISVIRNIVALNTSSSNNHRLGMAVFTSGALRIATSDTTNVSADTVNTLTTNSWHFGAAVHASTTSHRVILDGDTANATTNTTSKSPVGIDRFSIGVNDASTQSQFFSGQIWATGLWNVALNDEEIVAMAKGFPMGRVRPWALKQFIPYPGLSGRARYGGDMSITGATASANTPSTSHPV